MVIYSVTSQWSWHPYMATSITHRSGNRPDVVFEAASLVLDNVWCPTCSVNNERVTQRLCEQRCHDLVRSPDNEVSCMRIMNRSYSAQDLPCNVMHADNMDSMAFIHCPGALMMNAKELNALGPLSNPDAITCACLNVMIVFANLSMCCRDVCQIEERSNIYKFYLAAWRFREIWWQGVLTLCE